MTAEVSPSGAVEVVLDAARAGADPHAPRVLLVTGGPGAGRTAIVERLVGTLDGAGTTVRSTRADDASRARPFALLVDLLGPDVGAPTASGVLDRALSALETLCRDGRVVLVVDDAHRADPDSLAALVRLVATTNDLPIAFVLTRLPVPERSALTTLALRSDAADVRLHGHGDEPPLRRLDPACRGVLQVLAVWGGPASPQVLATILESTPASVAGAAARAVAAQVLEWTAGGRLRFRRGDHRDVVLHDLTPPVRRALGDACRTARQRAVAVEPDDPIDVPAALRAATTDVARAPRRAAELLDRLAERLGDDDPDADAVALERAGIQALLGDVGEAERIARERRARSVDPAARARFTRLLLFTLVGAAEVEAADQEIDAALARAPAGSPDAAALHDVRRWLGVLAGRAPVPRPAPAGGAAPSVAGLLCDAIELFLAGRTGEALVRAQEAAARRGEDERPAWQHGPTTEVWPAFLALHHHGPPRARELSIEARRALHREGRSWLTPYHQFVSAGIHVGAGRWDDALAEARSGLEAAEVTGTGWVSLPTATLALVHVRRGDLDRASDLVRSWRTRDLPEQFGLPLMAHAEALLLEAHDRSGDAAALVAATWARALDGGRRVWALIAGPEAVRIAAAAGDDALVARLASDAATLPDGGGAAVAPCVELLAAVARGDAARAGAAARAYGEAGAVLGEILAWELTAGLAARAGDRGLADDAARRCTTLATRLDAPVVGRRLSARLRELGMRQGSTVSRRRPRSGWESLTPTEHEVTDLVAQGLTSPQIAGRLFVSPRTVQTHISHVLRKLGLRSRVELAAEVARHRRR